MRRIRGYQTHHQLTDRAGACARQPHDFGAASSANPYVTSEALKSEVMHRYVLMISSYEDEAKPVL
jgi:hypothetical protein